MPDNLNIHGIEDDTTRPHKKRGGRKPFVIESRLVPPPGGWPKDSIWRSRIFRDMGEWGVYGRYKTESARDEALAAVVKREDAKKHLPYYSRMGRHEYRIGG
jgi:hypothetical protein